MQEYIPHKLVGFANFKRNNPKSDRFAVKKFHHFEFYCGDATNVSKRFQVGLGMELVAKSDLQTGNSTYASYVMQTNDLRIVFTAPYSVNTEKTNSVIAHPKFDAKEAHEFFAKHGIAAKAIGIEVADAAEAFKAAVANGATPMHEPVELVDAETGKHL